MQFLFIFFMLVAVVSLSRAETIFKEITENFLNDFFRTKNYPAYNIKGCWNLKRKLSFAKKQVKDQYFRKSYFVNDINVIQEINLRWLVADAHFCNITRYLIQINEKGMFRLPHKHLVLIPSRDFDYYISLSKSLNILPMSEVILANFNVSKVILFTIYNIKSDGFLLTEQYGTWTKKSGFKSAVQEVSLAERRRNFQKYPLKQGVVIYDDQNVLKSDFDDIARTSEFLFQQEMPVLFSLLQCVNATIEINVYNIHGYGKLNKSTGEMSGDGMIKDLFEEKIDLTSTMYLTSERQELFQPLAPINLWGLKFFLKKPSLSYVKNIYVLTLSKSVWIATLLITVMFMGSLYVSLNWEIRHDTKHKISEPSVITLHRANISDMILLSFEALCQQGTFFESFKVAGRILILLFLLMFMFIYVAYSANILVLLSSTSKLNSLSDLLESRFEVGGLNQKYVKHYFQSPKHGILRKLYLQKIHPGQYFDTTKGLEKVQKGNFAFFAPIVHSYNYFLKNFTNHDICALQELPGYMNQILCRLLNIQERGIAERSKVRMARKPRCINQGGSFQSVRIFDCLYVITIFIYGVGLSIIVLLLEIIIKRYLESVREG